MNFSHHYHVRRYQEQFLPVNLSTYKTVGVLPLLFTSEFPNKKFTVAQPRSLQNLENADFHVNSQTKAEKPTRLYFARAVSLFCSLTLLFGGVLHDVAVVVFLNSLLSLLFGGVLHDVAVVVFLNSPLSLLFGGVLHDVAVVVFLTL